MNELIIGTRGSKLALWQAHYTQQKLKEIGVPSTLKIIKTQGDKIQHLSFDKIEGKGFFTKEIEDALLEGSIHLAVHSMKDMPTTQPEGLCLAGVSYREDPADCLIIRKSSFIKDNLLGLKKNAIIGTSSARRKAQIKSLIPESIIKDIRGNVPTRLKKLEEGNFDAILLAQAGINRLKIDLEAFVHFRLDPTEFVPAPAQGVLTWQCRKEDKAIQKIIRQIHDDQVLSCTNVERKVLQLMDGGCHLPLGVHCMKDALGNYHAHAIYAVDSKAAVKKILFSSSTSKNMAEQIYQKLLE